ncbi:hypothetical protein JCM14076_25330 [Methylosoma difficile]
MSDWQCLSPHLRMECAEPQDVSQWQGRQVFHQLMQAGDTAVPLANAWLQQQLTVVERECGGRFVAFKHKPIADLLLDLSGAGLGFHSSRNDGFDELVKCQQALLPVLLTEAEGLAAVSTTASSDHPWVCRLFAIYLAISQDGFYQQTNSAGLPVSSWAFAAQPAIADGVFDWAATQKAFAYQARVFLPELLGFSWALFHADLGFDESFRLLRRARMLAQQPELLAAIVEYCGLFAEDADVWRRIQNGFWLYQRHLQAYQHISQSAVQRLTPEQVVAKLFAGKAAAACGHHRTLRLGGRLIDEWFADQPFATQAFMQALRESAYVDLNQPEQSRLLKLFTFDGPMFGVLTAEEQQVLADWLLQGAVVGQANTQGCETAMVKSLPIDVADLPKIKKRLQLGKRQLFHYLVNADLYPDVAMAAKSHVKSVLRRAQVSRRLPFKHYSHQRFQAYLNALYQNEIQSYQPLTGMPKLSKKAYLWGIEQFAPTILTDGCWLQHGQRLRAAGYHAIADRLGIIYQDEIGAGKHRQNHPLIYRQLLESVGFDMPPIASPAFIEYPNFLDSAFDLPVYLMAISQFPNEFLPELLGLNMAIELSGLGKVYLRLADELRYWGINPVIVNLHTTIDNTASGHAALAQQAIALHLDAVAASAGEAHLQQHWRRVYTGYCSLHSAAAFFKWALVGRYLFNQRGDFALLGKRQRAGRSSHV